jgi:hypothetical protein
MYKSFVVILSRGDMITLHVVDMSEHTLIIPPPPLRNESCIIHEEGGLLNHNNNNTHVILRSVVARVDFNSNPLVFRNTHVHVHVHLYMHTAFITSFLCDHEHTFNILLV